MATVPFLSPDTLSTSLITSAIPISAGWNEGNAEPTPAVDVWRTQGVGFLDLTPGLTNVEIRVLSKPGTSVMDLHQLRLRRTGDI